MVPNGYRKTAKVHKITFGRYTASDRRDYCSRSRRNLLTYIPAGAREARKFQANELEVTQ
ncbi:MAG: hypothetical protein DMG13_21925 [Acidobacteria bacterium]|nr:MAG: hypothetical protein DMG13_21925 [Acidobacteriota bacterium]